ncbi:MAG: ribosome silencing factor [Aliidongia sp.]
MSRTRTKEEFPIAKPAPAAVQAAENLADMLGLIVHTLDEGKAEDIVVIDLEGKSSLADHLVIASGRSSRQVTALAEQVASKLKDAGHGRVPSEGKAHGDWVLLDAGDVIVHLFRPEVRQFYNLEKMWGAAPMPTPEAGRTL